MSLPETSAPADVVAAYERGFWDAVEQIQHEISFCLPEDWIERAKQAVEDRNG